MMADRKIEIKDKTAHSLQERSVTGNDQYTHLGLQLEKTWHSAFAADKNHASQGGVLRDFAKLPA